MINTLGDSGPIFETETSRSQRLWYWAFLFRRTKSTETANYGNLAVPDQLAFVVGQDVNIAAPVVENIGGEIDANGNLDTGGNVTIDAEHIRNQGMVIGSLRVSETCTVVCYGEGFSDVRLVGGHINAAADITLNASNSITDEAGQLLALGDLNLNAQTVSIQGQLIPTVVSRPSGLSGLWHKNRVWSFSQDQGGLFLAPNGAVNVRSPEAIRLTAGDIQALAINAPSGIDRTLASRTISPVGSQHLGVFEDLLQELGLD